MVFILNVVTIHQYGCMVVKSLVYLADEIRVDLSPLAAQCIASEERTWLVLIPLPAFIAYCHAREIQLATHAVKAGENSQFIQIYREKFVVKQPENYETVDSDLDMRITPAKRVASSTWGPPPRCKQALKGVLKWNLGKIPRSMAPNLASKRPPVTCPALPLQVFSPVRLCECFCSCNHYFEFYSLQFSSAIKWNVY